MANFEVNLELEVKSYACHSREGYRTQGMKNMLQDVDMHLQNPHLRLLYQLPLIDQGVSQAGVT